MVPKETNVQSYCMDLGGSLFFFSLCILKLFRTFNKKSICLTNGTERIDVFVLNNLSNKFKYVTFLWSSVHYLIPHMGNAYPRSYCGAAEYIRGVFEMLKEPNPRAEEHCCKVNV